MHREISNTLSVSLRAETAMLHWPNKYKYKNKMNIYPDQADAASLNQPMAWVWGGTMPLLDQWQKVGMF